MPDALFSRLSKGAASLLASAKTGSSKSKKRKSIKRWSIVIIFRTY
jgi:hypothetical protein